MFKYIKRTRYSKDLKLFFYFKDSYLQEYFPNRKPIYTSLRLQLQQCHIKILTKMKNKRTKPWTIVGVIIAIILLIYWLLTITIVEEDENVVPILNGTEEVTP